MGLTGPGQTIGVSVFVDHFSADLGLEESGLDQVIHAGYGLLSLLTAFSFAELAASVTTMGQVDREGSVETILGEAVSGNHFRMLGLGAGRLIARTRNLVSGSP